MTKKLWGGRFKKKINPLVERFTQSIGYDWKLAEYDVLGSIVHTEILKKCRYLNSAEASKLQAALMQIGGDVRAGRFKKDAGAEDIHSQIQDMLEKKVGDLALKLQTARSRNEQVSFATRLYCAAHIGKLKKLIDKLIAALNDSAKKNKSLIIPGFTHMQHAQPVLLADHFKAYACMIQRDKARLSYISEHLGAAMGAGAVAGTPIGWKDYENAAKGYSREVKDYIEKSGIDLDIKAVSNSLDLAGDRDFVIEILSALSIAGMHISRMAEDLIIWSTKEFDFVEIDESFCTGSSLMPQKKNPDSLELIRGYTGRLYGNLVGVLTVMKGLPLSYNRDMQLDKEALFDSFEKIAAELEVLAAIVKTIKFNKGRIGEQLKDESLYATDIVYYLIEKGVAFKNAHDIVGRLIRYSADRSKEIRHMSAGELKRFSDKLVKSRIVALLDPKASVKSKRSVKRK